MLLFNNPWKILKFPLGEKQWMWCHLHPKRATTSFQMRHSQGTTFPIALSTSPSSLSCVSAPRIGLVPPVPQWHVPEVRHALEDQWRLKVSSLGGKFLRAPTILNHSPGKGISITKEHSKAMLYLAVGIL
jgi:hypothetical protein